MKRVRLISCGFVVFTFISCSQPESSAGVNISDVWSRPAHAMQDDTGNRTSNGVIYLTIENKGTQPDRMTAVASDIAEQVEIHETRMVEGKMTMAMVKEGVPIKAGEKIQFKPGGLHIMLIGLKKDLKVGDRFNVQIDFENAESKTVSAEIRG